MNTNCKVKGCGSHKQEDWEKIAIDELWEKQNKMLGINPRSSSYLGAGAFITPLDGIKKIKSMYDSYNKPSKPRKPRKRIPVHKRKYNFKGDYPREKRIKISFIISNAVKQGLWSADIDSSETKEKALVQFINHKITKLIQNNYRRRKK